MFVVLIRHAEPVATGADPALSSAGANRAATLAKMLGGTGLNAIFTSDLRRTKDTAAPLAALLSLMPSVVSNDPVTAAAQVRAAGKRVLVVGHTNTVPPIIKALGGPASVIINATEFDRVFVLHSPATGAESLLAMRYGV